MNVTIDSYDFKKNFDSFDKNPIYDHLYVLQKCANDVDISHERIGRVTWYGIVNL